MTVKQYVFPAIFSYEDEGICISFPDLAGCFSCGGTEDEAVRMAREALELWVASAEMEGESIPEPTPLLQLKVGDDQRAVLIDTDSERARKGVRSLKTVKKTLSIPEWLNRKAMEEGVNFSQLLTEALKRKLDVA